MYTCSAGRGLGIEHALIHSPGGGADYAQGQEETHIMMRVMRCAGGAPGCDDEDGARRRAAKHRRMPH